MISFKINWFDLLAVQRTLKRVLQHRSSKTLILSHSAFFIVQCPALTFVHDYWEDQSLDYTTFVGKAMSVLFNTLSKFVIAFLPKSNRLLISWLQSPSTVILEPKKRKFVTVSTFSLLFAMK